MVVHWTFYLIFSLVSLFRIQRKPSKIIVTVKTITNILLHISKAAIHWCEIINPWSIWSKLYRITARIFLNVDESAWLTTYWAALNGNFILWTHQLIIRPRWWKARYLMLLLINVFANSLMVLDLIFHNIYMMNWKRIPILPKRIKYSKYKTINSLFV